MLYALITSTRAGVGALVGRALKAVCPHASRKTDALQVGVADELNSRRLDCLFALFRDQQCAFDFAGTAEAGQAGEFRSVVRRMADQLEGTPRQILQ